MMLSIGQPRERRKRSCSWIDGHPDSRQQESFGNVKGTIPRDEKVGLQQFL
jgi:hypothetical protein